MTRQEKGWKLIAKAKRMEKRAWGLIAKGHELKAKAIDIWEQGWRLENGQRQHEKFGR